MAEVKKDSVVSADGTVIGYRVLGSGPGLVLVHGGMADSSSLMGLAGALADAFTVYVPDRRGRGMSGPYGEAYGIRKDVEDLDALLKKTGACYVFGLSSGALITLQAMLSLRTIRKAALYEPPLAVDASFESTMVPMMRRFDDEVAKGDPGAAFVTMVKGLELKPLSLVPRFLLVGFFRRAMADKNNNDDDHASIRTLIPTQHYDFEIVKETKGTLDNFKAVGAGVLLLGGSQSPRFLKNTLGALSKTLPNVRRVEFPGYGHTAPVEGGDKPERIAEELRRFFS